MQKNAKRIWIRPAAILIGLTLLPVSVSRVPHSPDSGVGLVVNDACGQGTGGCCPQYLAVCDPFPEAPRNHKYFSSGSCSPT